MLNPAPGEEEDHGAEVGGRLPVLHRVARPVHDVHPTLLARSLLIRYILELIARQNSNIVTKLPT